ncbi:energy transducer TonB [Amylibacter sp. SFDW26]|uniref:energy transducer TonB n=1 Tax=Amylibacter sp. SFDW26 TaxID=2652722 RepID=UPI0012626CCF|nr:TonB family protein [Amylibacter sp. SFDW26]KAB7615855.1 energy transducer TonB [Amylibacter sp. SFDW26]
MKRYAEIAIFGSIAVGIHIAGFYTIPAKGVQSGGAGGEDAVSILGANQQIERMVQKWEEPPELAETLDIKPITQPTPDQAPAIAAPSSQTAAVLLPNLIALTAPNVDEPVKIQTETAKPIPKPKPKDVEKPKQSVKKKLAPKAEKAQVASSRQKEQKSAGLDNGAFAGKGQSNVTTGVSKKQIADMKQVWGAKIRRRIERSKKYPRGTRKNGKAMVKLTVGRAGNIIAYSLKKSSGTNALDTAALQAISNTHKFPSAPKGLSNKSYVFTVPIVFRR